MSTEMLKSVEAIHVATVLEDCVDQLAILGRIMPASFEERRDADEVCKINSEINYQLIHYMFTKITTYYLYVLPIDCC